MSSPRQFSANDNLSPSVHRKVTIAKAIPSVAVTPPPVQSLTPTLEESLYWKASTASEQSSKVGHRMSSTKSIFPPKNRLVSVNECDDEVFLESSTDNAENLTPFSHHNLITGTPISGTGLLPRIVTLGKSLLFTGSSIGSHNSSVHSDNLSDAEKKSTPQLPRSKRIMHGSNATQNMRQIRGRSSVTIDDTDSANNLSGLGQLADCSIEESSIEVGRSDWPDITQSPQQSQFNIDSSLVDSGIRVRGGKVIKRSFDSVDSSPCSKGRLGSRTGLTAEIYNLGLNGGKCAKRLNSGDTSSYLGSTDVSLSVQTECDAEFSSNCISIHHSSLFERECSADLSQIPEKHGSVSIRHGSLFEREDSTELLQKQEKSSTNCPGKNKISVNLTCQHEDSALTCKKSDTDSVSNDATRDESRSSEDMSTSCGKENNSKGRNSRSVLDVSYCRDKDLNCSLSPTSDLDSSMHDLSMEEKQSLDVNQASVLSNSGLKTLSSGSILNQCQQSKLQDSTSRILNEPFKTPDIKPMNSSSASNRCDNRPRPSFCDDHYHAAVTPSSRTSKKVTRFLSMPIVRSSDSFLEEYDSTSPRTPAGQGCKKMFLVSDWYLLFIFMDWYYNFQFDELLE